MPIPYRLGALRREWSFAPGGAYKDERHVVRSHAVDFPLGFGEGDVERDGIYDYDFDVVEYKDGRGNQDAYVLLVSGERPTATTLFSIRQAQPAYCPLCACA